MPSDIIEISQSDIIPQEKVPPPPSPQRVGSWHEIKTVFDLYDDFFNSLPEWSYVEQQYDELIKEAKRNGRLKEVMRRLGKEDRYFLLTRILRRPDARHELVYKMCRLVESDPDGCLDLWSREHYKTSLITFAGSIQEVLNNPEITIGIFSFTKPIAKSFLRQIKREFEGNELLKALYQDILWADPRKQSKVIGFSWSVDNGITVKRQGNPKEATIEAHGLTDGQPTSKHFVLRIYNDVVTKDTVKTAGSIANTTDSWELSLSLGMGEYREWYEGTIYNNADTYSVIRDRGAAKIRLMPCTYDGTETGEPVMKTRSEIAEKRRSMGLFNFSAQWLLRPEKAGSMGFEEVWLRYWPAVKVNGMTIYIFVDPAGSKKVQADYTAMGVIGIGADRKKYLIDGLRERLNLKQRTEKLFQFVYTYSPLVVYYEKYGMQSDIEHIEEEMDRRTYRFDLQSVSGPDAKFDRVNRLQPDFEDGVWYIPQTLPKVAPDGERYDLIYDFIHKEYLEWPFPSHDDFLDMMSRIYDVPLLYPNKLQGMGTVERVIEEDEAWEPLKMKGGWR